MIACDKHPCHSKAVYGLFYQNQNSYACGVHLGLLLRWLLPKDAGASDKASVWILRK